MADPVRCVTCGKELLWAVLANTTLIADEIPPAQCYECEMKELTQKVAHALMDDEDKGYGFDGPG